MAAGALGALRLAVFASLHKHGEPRNLLALEIKKTNSRRANNFDFPKLAAYQQRLA